MSSRKSSFENRSDFSSNSTTHNNENNNNNNASADTQDKSINLNEFLDFLNLSCHVNDMISHNNDECQKQQKDLSHTEKFSGVEVPSGYANQLRTNGTHSPVPFKTLYQNRLVNNLFGFKRNKRLTAEDIQDNDDMSSGDSARAVRSSSTTLKNSRKKSSSKYEGGLHMKLNEKLDYVLNEGILDAVLPFVCPVPLPSNFTTRLKPKQKETKNQKDITTTGVTPLVSVNIIEGGGTLSDKDSSSKVKGKSSVSQLKTATLTTVNKNEPEVVIHVCDEVKNTSKDFLCPQRLLVSKMGYFADVTAGQNLADMDISVHCDIQIFEWLMKWIKSESGHSSSTNVDQSCADAPNLNVNNVIPILVSACFLQMEPLILDCLTFCHSNLEDIVRVSTNLSCLNDTIITRMAAMFTNVELEMVCDKKNRLLPRLWIKLICSLFEPETEALRGHYYSLAGLFKCSKCQKCLTNTMKSYIQCAPGNVRLNRWGQIINHHVPEPSWDLNYYITQLFKEVKSWRLVYWKLWGQAHYLYCCLCEMYFPVYQMFWCRYHPEPPVFLGPLAEGCTTGPAGRYTCCGQQTFRYETVPGPHGCQFREHSVLVETDRERSVLSIVQLVIEGNGFTDCPPSRVQEVVANGEIGPRWKCISLMPQRCRQGLLPTVLDPDESNSRSNRCGNSTYSNIFTDSSSETESSVTMDNVRVGRFGTDDDKCSCSTSGSDGCESSDVQVFLPKKSFKKKQNRKREFFETPGRYWSSELSARNNQDHQRDFEEKVMKQMMTLVQKKIGSELGFSQQNRPLGGTYVKLEHEWKEQLKLRMNNSGSSSSTNSQISNPSNSITLNVKGTRKKVDSSGQ